ncbi:MAG: N-acyl homoserine lactonase family protein [Chloroflexota bacterium]
MANCTIYPVPMQMTVHDKSVLTYRFNFGQAFAGTMYAWLIDCGKEKILVDAGVSTEYTRNVRKMWAYPLQTLDEGLGKLGVAFGDIDIVLFTQLHHDHTAYASRIPRARMVVQQKELDFARNPHPAFAEGYNWKFIEDVKFDIISGDAKINDDVSVFFTPGHTPGGQSVSVKTSQGNTVIAGLCACRDNFSPPPNYPLPVITPGIHTSTLDAYDSCIKIKEMADFIIPIHDPEFLEKRSIS